MPYLYNLASPMYQCSYGNFYVLRKLYRLSLLLDNLLSKRTNGR